MSDQGFDFGPTPPRREARQFEPPPWERDQFERHKREQAEREAAAEEARSRELAEREAAEAAERHASADKAGPGLPDTQPSAVGEHETEPPATPAPVAEVDEKQVALMLLNLRAEEPLGLQGAWAVNAAAGVVVALVGFASSIWGAVALTKKGMPAAGTLGGFVLMAFGLGFLGVGGWLMFKALRQRGVL